MTLIATPGAPDANSYLTVVEADAYHASRLYNTAWTSATNPNKEAALIWATRLLDRESWYGQRTSQLQALRWPRVDTYDLDGYYIDSTIVPQVVKNATAELAFLLSVADRTVEAGTEGFKKIKVGSIELEIDAMDRVKSVSPEVYDMLRGYIEGRNSVRMMRG